MYPLKILYDVELRRPGCVLLQAVADCPTSVVSRHFPAETWLTYPTKDMKVYTVKDEHQLKQLVAYTTAT